MDDSVANQLFVEAFGSREFYIEQVMRELDKTDALEEKLSMNKLNMKFTRNFAGQLGDDEEEEGVAEEHNETSKKGSLEEVIDNTMMFLDDLQENHEKSRYVKVFTEKTGIVNIGICHPRINLVLKQKKRRPLNFPSEFKTGTKTFTSMTATTTSGRSNTVSAFCTLTEMKKIPQEQCVKLFSKLGEDIPKSSEVPKQTDQADDQALIFSQDFPTLQHSTTSQTMLHCELCQFMTREKDTFNSHLKVILFV